MIAGLSGSILSHDALLAAGLVIANSEAHEVERAVGRWHARLQRHAGPAWSARVVFDEIAAPLCTMLGYYVLATGSHQGTVHAVLQNGGRTLAAVVAVGWGQDQGQAWRDAVRVGIAASVRWCFSFNGPSLRLFDVSRTHSRRYAEFDLARVATEAQSFGVLWRLLSVNAFASASLDQAVTMSERHRTEVRESLQQGVEEALTHLTGAFLSASRRKRADRTSTSVAFDESLVVIYRILFLLFAEARGIVPTWHPIFRDSYTIEALRPVVETRAAPAGVWAALQAIARLAHRGCRAGTLRVPPFNGRLFSPAHAPLAEALPLDERRVRDALLALTTRRGADSRQRISYADLGVEQLGGVYERVLDFDVKAVDGVSPSKAVTLVRSGRRKTTGSFYTPRSLTEHLVRRTLAPLAADATPDQILTLRIVDPAMGSGAFLVAACRYLAHAYEQALTREGTIAASDLNERDRAGFRRVVAQRCLYGVDINPMAVQLARLSLWLATLSGDRPLTFFDHHLRSGNSLAGGTLQDATRQASRRRGAPALPLFDDAGAERAVGAAVTSHLALRDGLEDTLDQVRAKERLFAEATSPSAPISRWKRVLDLWCAGWFGDGRRHGRAVFQALLDGNALTSKMSDALLEEAASTAQRERFFHWALEFPEIFAAPDGSPLANAGFDAVIGNPPWEVLHGPDAAALTRFSRDSGVYRLQGSGHANLFQLFVERALAVTRPGGRLGLVLPSGFATDHGCASLRRHLLDATTVDSLMSIENRDALFPIHRGLKFLMLTTTAGGMTTTVPLRVGVRAAAEFDTLPDRDEDPRAVPVTRALLERLSGEQLAIPELRTRADAELASRLTLAHRPAGDIEGWGLAFGRELNATDDRQHFTGRRDGTIPIVEGKQIQPFQADIARSAHFIDPRTARTLLPGAPFRRARLAYRDVASSTNRLTLIAAVLPAGTVTTHTLFCLKTLLDDDAQQVLCGLLNSFVANYLVRLRVTTHVTVTIVERLPLPSVPRHSRRFVDMGALARGLSRDADVETRARHQALAARCYELTAAEFEHVLSTFPLIERAERDRALAKFVDTI
jgi:hypothetical protein